MNPRALSLLLLAGVAGSGAQAAGDPVTFTAPLVRSGGAWPVEEPAASLPLQGNRLTLRGRTPRALAEEVALTFEQACVQGRGTSEAATDWALQHGFSPLPEPLRDRNAKLVDPRAEANVFARNGADDVMLVAGGEPTVCAVLTRRAVDGPKLRSSMERFVTAWAGLKSPPKPVMSMDTGTQPTRMVGYKFVEGDQRHTLLVVSPVAAASGIAFLGYSADETPPPQ